MSNLINLLVESHKDLNQWFLLHQECLLLGSDALAQVAFAAFALHLRQHIEFENGVVLPAAQAAACTLCWKPDIYLKEHGKIEKMLARLELSLASYCRLTGRKKRLALLELLDNEQSLKGVMEHHEQREEKDLFLQTESFLPDAATVQWQAIEQLFSDQTRELKQNLKNMLEG